ncbi:MAG: long-chain N-acyl amino acid synthase [Betaproteobacteria bacterium HGW-Betaproteobacteria-19]|nr:MAG: long-chain N-acyl amino acid synthase [Betaproteobacteria bacterium HGW-Betaproteobacteria-19]
MIPEAIFPGQSRLAEGKTEPAQHARGALSEAGRQFAMSRDGYHIRLANDFNPLQQQIAGLIERMYSTRGLMVYHPELAQTDRQTTIVACRGDHLFATLTLGLDAASGLMADMLYSPEINAVRARGGRVCEVTRMAMDPEHNSPEVMADIFQLVYVLARRIYRMTDLFIEVHPRHAGFYRRMLGYRVVGDERVCPRVGAPAVLMHMSQHEADELIALHAGKDSKSTRSLYRLFSSPAELLALQKKLTG